MNMCKQMLFSIGKVLPNRVALSLTLVLIQLDIVWFLDMYLPLFCNNGFQNIKIWCVHLPKALDINLNKELPHMYNIFAHVFKLKMNEQK